MRRIRFVALGIVSFVVSIFGALLAPGTFLNRALSAALCTVFSFNSAVCTVSLVQSSNRVVAVTPPAVERSIADISGYLQAQRDPSEFGDEPSAPSPGSNPQAPPFPQDPGPNFPVRPEFDNPNLSQPNQPQPDLAGVWLYSIYRSPSDNAPLRSSLIRITQTGDGYRVSTCANNCGSIRQPRSRIASSVTLRQPSTETYGNITVTTAVSTDGQSVQGNIRERISRKVIFFAMERQVSPVSLYPIENLSAKSLTLNIGSGGFLIVDTRIQPVTPTTPTNPNPYKPPGQSPGQPSEPPPPPPEEQPPETPPDIFVPAPEPNPLNPWQKAVNYANEHPFKTLGYLVLGVLVIAVAWEGVAAVTAFCSEFPLVCGSILTALGQAAPLLAEQPPQPQQTAVTARISQIDDVATIYIDGRKVKEGGYAGGGKGGDTGWGPIDVGSGTHQVRLVVNNTLAGGSGGWFEIKVNGQLKINQGRPLQEDRVTGIKYDTTTTLEVP